MSGATCLRGHDPKWRDSYGCIACFVEVCAELLGKESVAERKTEDSDAPARDDDPGAK